MKPVIAAAFDNNIPFARRIPMIRQAGSEVIALGGAAEHSGAHTIEGRTEMKKLIKENKMNLTGQNKLVFIRSGLLAVLSLLLLLPASRSSAATIRYHYQFSRPEIIQQANGYQLAQFPGCIRMGRVGQPLFPMQDVALLLPVGHTATSIEIRYSNKQTLTEPIMLEPRQRVRNSGVSVSGFFVDETCYSSTVPVKGPAAEVQTHFLHGYPIALACFSPIEYIPVEMKLSFFEQVEVIIETSPNEKAIEAEPNLIASRHVFEQIQRLIRNKAALSRLSFVASAGNDYEYLIITITEFIDDYQSLAAFYEQRGIRTRIAAVEEIYGTTAGRDSQEKIRNFIIEQYRTHHIQTVLLAGDADADGLGQLQVPVRGLHTKVQSGSDVYESNNIPSDLYYAALDGNWNTDNDEKWGEPDEADLLPELAVGRITADNPQEIQNVITKSIRYQSTPVMPDATKMLFLGEHLWSDPLSYGADYLNLLIGNQDANGYATVGMSQDLNFIFLYDKTNTWNSKELLSIINDGCNLIAHDGHASYGSVMKLNVSQITNENFIKANGIDHLNPIVYSHGCSAAAFDKMNGKTRDSIGEEMVNIETFAAAFIGNSRYGWFNEGQTEGPSLHLHREFISALYGDSVTAIGAAQTLSRIRTAPFVTAPDQWEPGALRWCFYGCNVIGDPALQAWTHQIPDTSNSNQPVKFELFSPYPNPFNSSTMIQFSITKEGRISLRVYNLIGQKVTEIANDFYQRGTHKIVWNAAGSHQTGLASGIYYLQLRSVEGLQTQKVVLIK